MTIKQEEEIKIEKMVLNIDGEKVNLSLEQAKKLKKILDELFGKEIIREVEHVYLKDWYYRPWYCNMASYSSNILKVNNFSYYDAIDVSNNILGVNL